MQTEVDQNLPLLDESLLHSNYQLVRSARPHITGYISPEWLTNVSHWATNGAATQQEPSSTYLQEVISQTLPELHNNNLGYKVAVKSEYTLNGRSDRPGSPYYPKPTQRANMFGLSPRSMRLRPLPRSVASHASAGRVSAYNTMDCSIDHFQSSLSLVQGCNFGNDVNDVVGNALPAPPAEMVLNRRMFPDHVIVRPPRRSAPPAAATTLTTTTTTATTTTPTSTGDQTTVRSVVSAHETAHPGNEDRMLVAVVTAAAAQVLAILCNDIVKNIEALARAELFVKSSIDSKFDLSVASQPAGSSDPTAMDGTKEEISQSPTKSEESGQAQTVHATTDQQIQDLSVKSECMDPGIQLSSTALDAPKEPAATEVHSEEVAEELIKQKCESSKTSAAQTSPDKQDRSVREDLSGNNRPTLMQISPEISPAKDNRGEKEELNETWPDKPARHEGEDLNGSNTPSFAALSTRHTPLLSRTASSEKRPASAWSRSSSLERPKVMSRPGSHQDLGGSRPSSPVRFQGFDEMDREVGVIADDNDDGEQNELGILFETTWTNQEAARSPGGCRYRKAAGSPSIDGFLHGKHHSEHRLAAQRLAAPSELAWRLISKFSTGFGLTTDELKSFSRTFVEKPRLRCFVGFVNMMGEDVWLQVRPFTMRTACTTLM